MQMIKVRVGHQDYINRGQVAQPNSRFAQPFQNKKPTGEVRIDHYILPAHLHKKAGVTNEGEAQFAIRHQLWFVGFADAWSDDRVPYATTEIAGPPAERRILQSCF